MNSRKLGGSGLSRIGPTGSWGKTGGDATEDRLKDGQQVPFGDAGETSVEDLDSSDARINSPQINDVEPIATNPLPPTGKVAPERRKVVCYPPEGSGGEPNPNQRKGKWVLCDAVSGGFIEDFAAPGHADDYMKENNMHL